MFLFGYVALKAIMYGCRIHSMPILDPESSPADGSGDFVSAARYVTTTFSGGTLYAFRISRRENSEIVITLFERSTASFTASRSIVRRANVMQLRNARTFNSS